MRSQQPKGSISNEHFEVSEEFEFESDQGGQSLY